MNLGASIYFSSEAKQGGEREKGMKIGPANKVSLASQYGRMKSRVEEVAQESHKGVENEEKRKRIFETTSSSGAI